MTERPASERVYELLFSLFFLNSLSSYFFRNRHEWRAGRGVFFPSSWRGTRTGTAGMTGVVIWAYAFLPHLLPVYMFLRWREPAAAL